ncbi:MAG: hypothetical protein HY562_09120 [Ignavibacteriales bacterium]|nr:hypothetical protein [Ignavibacteriales bacterium]
MDTVTDAGERNTGAVWNTTPEHIVERPMGPQEKLALLKELDAMMKKRYHQSLDDVLRDLYIHDVISKPDLSADEIVRTFNSIGILKNETGSLLRRFRF